MLKILGFSTISGFSTNSDSLYVSPNPFDTLTIIHFDIVQNDSITLEVFNMLGDNVRTFFQNTALPAGSYSINFHTGTLPNGFYLVSLKINSSKTLIKKVLKTSVGINENEYNKVKTSFYPNPTTGLLTIPFDFLKTIIVTDMKGLILKNIKTRSTELSISELENGTYIVTLLSDKELIFSTQNIILIK